MKSAKELGFLALIVLFNGCMCVPTSLLVNTKEASIAKKVKRAPSSEALLENQQQHHHAQQISSSGDQGSLQHKITQQKRGVNQKLLDEIQLANQLQASAGLPWEGSMNAHYQNPDLNELFGSGSADREALSRYNPFYDSEPAMIKAPLPYRYYSDRKKRSNLLLDQRKREAKLSPTEILTLLSLVEQAQRQGKIDQDDNYLDAKNYYQVKSADDDDDGEWLNGALAEPTIQYYPIGAPASYYEYNPYRANPAKRFMVSKRANLGRRFDFY
jgi:hypothetical protein